jgi:UDP-N-acetylglucosamine:LPS N-acetylglucosamine transferase
MCTVSSPRRVLILSSSMGAGHDGTARELTRRLEAAGHGVEVHDYLDALPLRIGHLICWWYRQQLRYLPGSYERSYRFMPRIYGLLAALNARLSAPRVRRWMAFEPDVVVSNNPLATLALGRLRATGRLVVPAVTYITDFGVHPLWVHPGIDLHLALDGSAAGAAGALSGGGSATAAGALVDPGFFAGERRQEVRRRLGLGPEDRAVLVVAGSWGVGPVEKTTRLLHESGRFVPVTVCGRDARVERRLSAAGLGVVLGWRDDMPDVMSACDVLVENAGGLTSLEAMAAGLPVVTYRPIPGHGRENAAAMERAGVSVWARSGADLLSALDEVIIDGPVRDRLLSAGAALFERDPADLLV